MSATGPTRKAKSGSRTDWETPQAIYDWLNQTYEFGVDLAASDTNTKHLFHFTAETNALAQDWGSFVSAFCNPPYGQLMPWVEKFAEQSALHHMTVVALLPNNTDTKWFQHCWETATEIVFLIPRLSFEVGGVPVKGNAGGSIVVVWRGRRLTSAGPAVSLVNWKEVVAKPEPAARPRHIDCVQSPLPMFEDLV